MISIHQPGLDLRAANVVVTACSPEPMPATTNLDGVEHLPNISTVSPFPLPEQIVHLVIDEIRLDRERALAESSHDSTQSTSKAIDHAFRFDAELKRVSLISKLWTRPARNALGRRLVLILDEERLPRLPIALDSPLYGPWTSHVEILEVPCTALRDKDSAAGIWASVQRLFDRLENVRSFTLNSRILWSSIIHLPALLPSFKRLENLTLINTGIIVTSIALDSVHQELANLTAKLPSFQRMTFVRCFPSGDSPSKPLSPVTTEVTERPPEFLRQLQALISSLYSSFNCCFTANRVSFAFDREEARWTVDEMTVSHLRSICATANCKYSDPSGACATVRSLHLIGDTKRYKVTCMANLLRNFPNAKVRCVPVGLPPVEDILEHFRSI